MGLGENELEITLLACIAIMCAVGIVYFGKVSYGVSPAFVSGDAPSALVAIAATGLTLTGVVLLSLQFLS